jgi:hypothetical protein
MVAPSYPDSLSYTSRCSSHSSPPFEREISTDWRGIFNRLSSTSTGCRPFPLSLAEGRACDACSAYLRQMASCAPPSLLISDHLRRCIFLPFTPPFPPARVGRCILKGRGVRCPPPVHRNLACLRARHERLFVAIQDKHGHNSIPYLSVSQRRPPFPACGIRNSGWTTTNLQRTASPAQRALGSLTQDAVPSSFLPPGSGSCFSGSCGLPRCPLCGP